jgi:hypothetical protein
MRNGKIVRLGFLLLLAVVLALSDSEVVQAKRFPKHGRRLIKFDLAAGASSDAMSLPAGQAVQVMGVTTTLGDRSVGQATVLRIAGSFLEWTGLESPAAAAITSGFSSVQGTHIVYINFSHVVDIEVNDPDTFRVHNGSSMEETGTVTVIW